jgi:hypothetical protein
MSRRAWARRLPGLAPDQSNRPSVPLVTITHLHCQKRPLVLYETGPILSSVDNIIGDTKMFDVNRLLFLRIALVVIGLTFIFGIYTLGILWPSGWVWGQGYSHYLMMIMGVYATLGVFLLIASRNPYAHKSLIWFTVWSSLVHGAIMGVQAVSDTAERGHLVGDAPALILVAIILAVLMPRTATLAVLAPRTAQA